MRIGYAVVLLSLCVTPLSAQRANLRFAAGQDSTAPRPTWPVARIAKWSTLLASTGAVAYGFTQNRTADREYQEIEQLCHDTPETCTVTGDGHYTDAGLEARYQSVVRRDDRAQMALLAGQVGIAASVLLFILDLPENTTPEDIPYDPRPIRFGARAQQMTVGVYLSVP